MRLIEKLNLLSRLDNLISREENNDRLAELQELLNIQQKKFNSSFISKNLNVLVKGKGKIENQYRGTTKWMQIVNFKAKRLTNDFVKVNIKKVNNNSLLGEI